MCVVKEKEIHTCRGGEEGEGEGEGEEKGIDAIRLAHKLDRYQPNITLRALSPTLFPYAHSTILIFLL